MVLLGNIFEIMGFWFYCNDYIYKRSNGIRAALRNYKI